MIDILKNKKVGVIMGGLSSEREVSLTSGGAVAAALRDAGYDVAEILYDGQTLPEDIRKAAPDVVFIALHGKLGEDGCVQGLLEVMGVPYTGPGVTCSALAMDKGLSKDIMVRHGIPTPDYVVIRKKGFDPSRPDFGGMTCPVVVKPANSGSTIGMSFAFREEELLPGVVRAFEHDDVVLIERFIEGRELTVGVIDGGPLPLVEVIIPGGVYDYEAKYHSTANRYVCPAELDAETTAKVQRLAVEVFDALRGYGVGRVDFRLDAEGNAWALEMNTIPGMTKTSLLPKAAAASGVDFTALVETILIGALRRNEG